MCKMPFYKMYPADAETDANFRLMDFAERGFYWSCLNMSWINGGLPADPEDRARLLSAPRDLADRYWVRVGRCFVASPDGLTMVNPRQERERAEVQTASERASQKAHKRWNNVPNDATASPQHMPDSDLDSDSASLRASDFCLLTSDSESVSEKPERQNTVRHAREAMPYPSSVDWMLDEHYQGFVRIAREFWLDLIDEDLAGWYPGWKALTAHEQLLAIRRIGERMAIGQDFTTVFKFTYFARGEWKRVPYPRNAPNKNGGLAVMNRPDYKAERDRAQMLRLAAD